MPPTLLAGSTSTSTPPGAGALLSPAAGSRRLVAGFGLVTLVAALHALHALSHGYPLAVSAFSGAMIVMACGALTAGHALTRRWRVARWPARCAAFLASAAFGALILLPLDDPWHFSRPFLAVGSVVVGLSVTGLWLLVFRLPVVVGRARLHALEVEALRREAELSRLRLHLHPHFLLNTLNAVAGLVGEDPAEARRILAALGDLVRDALAGGDELQPFAAEAAWLRRYADILEARHRGALSFRWELGEATLSVRTPRLLLQPLVENAVQHGALRRRGGGAVLVRSEALPGGAVRFTVEDDGPGLATGPARGEGLGVSLVRRRLALLCPGGRLRFEPLAPGTRAVIELPPPAGGRA